MTRTTMTESQAKSNQDWQLYCWLIQNKNTKLKIVGINFARIQISNLMLLSAELTV